LKKGEWTFLTNHGRVLAYIAKHPQSTTQEIAQEAGITLRAVQKIIAELEASGYLARHKEGRCNRYSVHPEIPMRHRLEREHPVGDILIALGYNAQKE
jgi:DNA-binding MarR family transcriptional regulator